MRMETGTLPVRPLIKHVDQRPFHFLRPHRRECYGCRMEPADDDLVSSIAPDVMNCLVRSEYFEKLDDLLSPEGDSSPPQSCDGTYKLSESVLLACGFVRNDLDDVFAVLQSKGGCCDCEVLYNVAETSRLKAKYWRSRAAGEPTHSPHSRPS